MDRAPRASKRKTKGLLALEASWYHDPAIYRREMQTVFARSWLLIGHERALQEPGRYIATTIAHRPVFVVRTKTGGLKGFHNVCRHRAGILVREGEGRCTAIKCLYHGWVYDTDGVLRRRPGFADDDTFDGAKLNLYPIAVTSWRGFVFVNLAKKPEPIERGLGDLPAVLAPFEIERYAFHGSRSFDLAFNWKTYTDNYLEGYHIPYMHQGLARDLDMTSYRVEPGNRVCIHRSGTARSDAAYQGLFLWRWPNNTIGVYGAGFNICRILPLAPQRMRLTFDFYFDPAAGLSEEEKDRAAQTTCDVVAEDFPMCEAVQANLESGVYKTGPLSPRHELGLALFHDLVRKAVAK